MIKITLDKEAYRDKVYACFIGKNIGGTMGAPYEGKREVLDVEGFVTEEGVVLPNDDLDLQLAWLYALEQYGPYAITPELLGEFWLSYIVPHWNEYGIGKANMRRGLPPPMSGDYDNDWQNSNGAWIRTEIWATVCPALPHAAAKYAATDAMVDHGAGEGTFAAAFVAAMQSAAFAVPELKKCIEIGLSAIPAESRMAKSIRFVLDLYEAGTDWLAARNEVQKLNADIGNGWFEAPSNVTYAVIGLLWGEGDFKKSMITAINCGDDTDCTAATVGATMGILYGMAGIPEDWRRHIGDDIVTISLVKSSNGSYFPKTCTELTERIVRIAPFALHANSTRYTNWGYTGVFFELGVELGVGDEIAEDTYGRLLELCRGRVAEELECLRPYTAYGESNLANATLSLGCEPDASRNKEIGVHLLIESKCYFESAPRTANFRWIIPDGFKVEGPKTLFVPDFNPHTCGRKECDFTIVVPENPAPVSKILLEISFNERLSPIYISFPIYS